MNIFYYMKLTDFDYHLPTELIAQTPVEPRDSSRLLMLYKTSGKIEDSVFRSIVEELWENDVLVVNKTRVINARLIGFIISKSVPFVEGESETKWSKGELGKKTTKQVEIFLHKQISENTWDCLVYPGKKLKVGTKVYFDKEEWGKWELFAIIKSNSEKWRIVEFSFWGLDFLKIVEKIGHTPLPPYIKEKLDDSERYQTVYNEIEWSAAAPTAGLHFTDSLLEKLEASGVKIEKVLLHVWLGTFMWVETENIEDHHMHSEYIELEETTAQRLNDYKKAGKRIIAVGTTSIRVLESFSDENWEITWWNSQTEIFIYPGYAWKFVDSLITNFHLPKSTLLMLVSSLAWKENIKRAYSHAVENEYRFFSFWDAMWIK